jgi:hypothetical protein
VSEEAAVCLLPPALTVLMTAMAPMTEAVPLGRLPWMAGWVPSAKPLPTRETVAASLIAPLAETHAATAR